MAFKMKGPWLKSFLKQKDYETEGYGDLSLVEGAAAAADSYVEPTPPDWAGIGQKMAEDLATGIYAAKDKEKKPTPKEELEASIKERNESEEFKNSQLKKDIDAQEAGTKERIESIIESMRPVPLEIDPPKVNPE
tara:strand:+ start:217 stop:621 length:405 start_codon:yes stop_codon:yes gene_type:complete